MTGGIKPDDSEKIPSLETLTITSIAQQYGPGLQCTGEGATVQLYSGQPDLGLVGEVAGRGRNGESERYEASLVLE